MLFRSKTAERLIIELRDKVESLSADAEYDSNAPYSIRSDAVAALISLGYNVKTAETAVRKALTIAPSASIEDVVKNALSVLNN